MITSTIITIIGNSRAITRYKLNGHLIVKVKPLTRSPMANPDPQNARPEGGATLNFGVVCWFS